VLLREIRIGDLAIEKVQGAVIDSLGQSVLGMSFLGRLKGFEMRDRVLTILGDAGWSNAGVEPVDFTCAKPAENRPPTSISLLIAWLLSGSCRPTGSFQPSAPCTWRIPAPGTGVVFAPEPISSRST
jgi:hypothetical protein